MKRTKQLTKRERKALAPPRPGGGTPGPQHIHCIACGRHIDPSEFNAPASATMLRCDHGSKFPACVTCETSAKARLAEHDRTGKGVEVAAAWH